MFVVDVPPRRHVIWVHTITKMRKLQLGYGLLGNFGGLKYARLGCEVWSWGFGVWSLGFGVWGLELGVWSLELGVWSLEFGVWGLGFGVWS